VAHRPPAVMVLLPATGMTAAEIGERIRTLLTQPKA
jgi:hypothetical protein